jgi:hypothetical protein
MDESDSTGFDKLSNLAQELEKIERSEGGAEDPSQADEVREGLIAAMRGVFKSHYDFAVWLDRYLKVLRAKKTVTAAMEKIATAYGCSSRTLYRLLSNYDDAKQLPLAFVDVMREQRLDPVRTANKPLVDELIAAPKPADHDEAKASLNAARAKVAKVKPAVQSTPNDVGESRQAVQNLATVPESANCDERKASPRAAANAADIAAAAQTPLMDAEVFATRVVRLFEERFGSYRGEDRDELIRFVLERVVKALNADVHELRTDDRPDPVRKPANPKP